MIRTNKLTMRGRPTHLHMDDFDFEILRVDGYLKDLPPSRYCYELRHNEKRVKRFEYQHEVKKCLGALLAEWRDIQRRHKEEKSAFMAKHGLLSFPKRNSGDGRMSQNTV